MKANSKTREVKPPIWSRTYCNLIARYIALDHLTIFPHCILCQVCLQVELRFEEICNLVVALTIYLHFCLVITTITTLSSSCWSPAASRFEPSSMNRIGHLWTMNSNVWANLKKPKQIYLVQIGIEHRHYCFFQMGVLPSFSTNIKCAAVYLEGVLRFLFFATGKKTLKIWLLCDEYSKV